MSDDTIEQVADDVADAIKRQFGSGKTRGDFRLRMSNVGRPTCQLWYEKNKPEVALPFPTTFVMNMMIGDIVEAVFKGLLKEAGVKYNDTEKVTLDLGTTVLMGHMILSLTMQLMILNRLQTGHTETSLNLTIPSRRVMGFGYIGQLAGYAKASGKRVGGWWVVNKANGQFKYVPASGLDIDEEINKIKDTVTTVEENKFERCFEPVPEKFRGKETGNQST